MEVKRRTIRTLVAKLSSVSEQTREESLAELRLLSKNDAEARPMIAEAGAVPYLAETLYAASHSSQEQAAAALLNLSISTRESLISTRGLLDALSHALAHHASTTSPEAVQSCAATIHSLAVADESYRSIIGSKRDIVFALIDVIKTQVSTPRTVKDALKALFAIALYLPNRPTMISLGAIGALFSLIVKDPRTGIQEDATAVVAQVVGCDESEEAVRKSSGVRILADLLDPSSGSSARTKENAVAALLYLSQSGGEGTYKEVAELVAAIEEGAVDGIFEVATNGSAKARRRAVELLKVAVGDNSDSGFESLTH